MMKSPAAGKKIARSLEHLIPTEFAYLFEDRPVLPFENVRTYNRLLADHISEFEPQTLIEFHWIRDLTDTCWEIMRLRLLKKAALDAETPQAAVDYLGGSYRRLASSMQLTCDDETLRTIAQGAFRDWNHSRETLEEILKGSGRSFEGLLYTAYSNGLRTINSIDVKLAKAERRRDELIKKFDERRQMLAAMNKSLIRKRPQDEIVDVLPVEQPADDGATD